MTDEPATASPSAERWLEVDEHEIAAARAFVHTAIESFGLHPVEDVELLTSEVVSNAIEHAVTDAVILRVSRQGGRIRVETHDDDPTLPHTLPADPARPGGLGMRLVAALAQDWGVEEIDGDGKVVWFEVDLPG